MSLNDTEYRLLKEFTELDGIASFEDDIRNKLKEEYTKLGYTNFIHDNLGSLFVLKKSKVKNAPRVMIDGHMDEVGFILANFEKDGLIDVAPIGGINLLDCLDCDYRLRTKDGKIFVGKVANKQITTPEEFKLDFGFKSDLEAKAAGLNYFDMITFITEFKEIEEDRYLCKAIDNRYSLVLGLEILRHFKNYDLPYDLYVGGSVQEEVGLRGAPCILNVIRPDLVIVLDCSRAVKEENALGHIGEGVLLRFFDPSMVAFKELIEWQKECCEKSGSKYQYFLTKGGTNAGIIHRSLDGVLTLNHCICALDIHTPHSVFAGSDYYDAKKSLICMVGTFNKEKLEKFKAMRK